MYRSRILASVLFISAVGGGVYLMACGSDSSEFDDTKKDGGLGGDADPGGGIGDGGIGGEGGNGGDGGECEHVIQAVIRDFKPCNLTMTRGEQADLDDCDPSKGHPDFEHYQGDKATTGIVAEALTLPDRKPAYVGDGPHYYQDPNRPNKLETTSKVAFESWYHDLDTGPNANKRVTVPLELKETITDAGAKHYVFDDRTFFPVDGKGWLNGPDLQDGGGNDHNFAFTTEAHFSFVYKGGEEFTFRGDDDLWLFINNKLAIDLGGLHPELLATVNLDNEAAKLGLVKGQRYPMDLFHAERHTTASRFRIDTTIECVTNSPVH